MICSSLARNRSPDPVVSCCFGRIVPSDATTESQFASKGNPENEIARFRALKPQYLAISILPARQKQILRQWASRCSQTTTEYTKKERPPRGGLSNPIGIKTRQPRQ